MMSFACKDIGVDCPHVVTGATKEEVMKAAMEHGSVVHADLMSTMTKEQTEQFGKALVAAIHTI